MSPAGSGRGQRRESLPVTTTTTTVLTQQSGSREQERVREALGQAVAKNSSENLKEEGKTIEEGVFSFFVTSLSLNMTIDARFARLNSARF